MRGLRGGQESEAELERKSPLRNRRGHLQPNNDSGGFRMSFEIENGRALHVERGRVPLALACKP